MTKHHLLTESSRLSICSTPFARGSSLLCRLHGDRVRITAKVFEGVEAVRLSGLTNMLDRPVVAEIAEEMGYEESARWVREHRDLYARAIFQGFEPIEKEKA